jgi:hypothetical protein
MAQLVRQVALSRRVIYITAAITGAAFVASGVLWLKLGTAVFFESIRAGLTYCFG